MRDEVRAATAEIATVATVPDGWHDLFVATAGAAAALAGLVVVAISINVREILSSPRLPVRAAITVGLLVNVLIIATLGLVPDVGLRTFGWLTLVGTAALEASVIAAPVRQGIDPARRGVSLLQFALTQVTLLPLVIGSAVLIAGNPSGLSWLTAGIVLSFAWGVENAWALLIEILR